MKMLKLRKIGVTVERYLYVNPFMIESFEAIDSMEGFSSVRIVSQQNPIWIWEAPEVLRQLLDEALGDTQILQAKQLK